MVVKDGSGCSKLGASPSCARICSGIAACLLVVIYLSRSDGRGVAKALFLTHWNYVGVIAVLITATWCRTSTTMAAATVASVVSLFVVCARLLFLRVKADKIQDMAWDVHTHIVVPFVPLVVLACSAGLVCPSPSAVLVPACAAIGVMAVWAAVNVYAQHVHPEKKWVYGKAANPRTAEGRKQMLYSLGLAGVCVASTVAVSQCHRL